MLHFFYQGSGFSIHRLGCLDMDFFAQAIVVQFDIGGEYIRFFNTVMIRVKVMQTIDFHRQAVFTRLLHQVNAGGAFLVGVGIDDEHRLLRVLFCPLAGV